MTTKRDKTADVPRLVRDLAHALAERSWKIAVAESCTGGSLGAAITDMPGSSAFFLGGVVAYESRLKTSLLGVSPQALAKHGAVSLEVAVQMADGCRARLGADLSVSITGIAGPGGGTASKPVGLVFIAVSTARGTQAEECRFPGDRADVRQRSVETALRLALAAAQNLEGVNPPR